MALISQGSQMAQHIDEMSRNYTALWSRDSSGNTPSEDLVRIFKGRYPNHAFDTEDYASSTICDLSVGEGRNLVFLATLGFDRIAGTEISREMVDLATSRAADAGLEADIRQGTNLAAPFDDGEFDYLVSWNSCYYVESEGDFPGHVAEFARILRPGGHLVLSIPMKSHRVLKDCEDLGSGYSVLRNDHYDVRNGAVWRTFADIDEITEAFSPTFTDFSTAAITDDMFGYAYHHHLVVCRKA